MATDNPWDFKKRRDAIEETVTRAPRLPTQITIPNQWDIRERIDRLPEGDPEIQRQIENIIVRAKRGTATAEEIDTLRLLYSFADSYLRGELDFIFEDPDWASREIDITPSPARS